MLTDVKCDIPEWLYNIRICVFESGCLSVTEAMPSYTVHFIVGINLSSEIELESGSITK